MIYCQMRDHKPLYRASLCMWKNSAAVHYVDIIWYNIIYVDNILSNMCWYVLGRFGGWTSITTRYFLSSDHGFPSSSQLPPSHRWSPPLPVGLGSNTEQKKPMDVWRCAYSMPPKPPKEIAGGVWANRMDSALWWLDRFDLLVKLNIANCKSTFLIGKWM